MPEIVTFAAAGRPVELVLEDDTHLTEVLGRVEGFTIEPTENPWMRVVFHEIAAPDISSLGPTPIQMKVLDTDDVHLCVPTSSCTLRFGSPHVAVVEALDPFNFFIYVASCFSLAFPRENALVLHSDTVRWRDQTFAFFGPSGTGKTTATNQLVARARARPLGTDRNILEVRPGERPVVHTLPRLQRLEPSGFSPETHPLTGLIFPNRGTAVDVQPMSKLEGFTRLLESVVMPVGSGQPMAEVMEILDRTLSQAWIAEMHYELGRDFSPELCLLERST